MKKAIYTIAAILTVISGCKEPDACFEANDLNFLPLPVEAQNCTDELIYGFWKFGDGEGSETTGEVSHRYQEEGYYDFSYTSYSKSGRQENTQTNRIFVGYKYVDSVVVESLPYAWLVDPITGDPIYLRVKIEESFSVENYKHPTEADFPLTFTFEEEFPLTIVKNNIKFYDLTSAISSPFTAYVKNEFENPMILGGTSTLRYKIYWHLKN